MRGGREERRHGCEGEAALLRGSEGEAAAVLDVGLRRVVMGLLVGWALHSSWPFFLSSFLISFPLYTANYTANMLLLRWCMASPRLA